MEGGAVIVELRTYQIRRGHMAEWLDGWAESAERSRALGIQIEFAAVDPESMGTFIWARSFESEEARQRLTAELYGSDWWKDHGDEIMSHVVTWEARVLQTAFERAPDGSLVDHRATLFA